MSNFKKCIINGVKEGLISESQAEKLNKNLDEITDFYQYKKNLSKPEAEKKAATEVYNAAKIEQAEKLRYTLQMKAKMNEIENDFATYKNENGEIDMANAYRAYLAQDNWSYKPNIENQTQIEADKAHALMSNLMDQFRYGWGGMQFRKQKANKKLMVRELMGERTGNVNAQELGETWGKVAEYLRKRANYFGMKILSRKDWGLPTIHDTLSVRSFAKVDWIDYILPKLDVDKMVDERSGLLFTDKSIREALDEVYESIATEGMATFKPGVNRYGKAMRNRRTDHRFLAFRSADDWMEYQARFGNPDPYKTMLDHINSMSRDIAILKILGPNPDATHTWATGMIKKQTAIDAANEAKGLFKRKKTLFKDSKLKGVKKDQVKIYRNETDRTNAILDNGENLLAYHKGNLSKPIDGFFGNTFASLRQILTSAQLGGAAIMTVTDQHWMRQTAKFNGLPSTKANVIAVKQLAEGIRKDKKLARLAVRLGLGAEMWSAVSAVQARYLNDIDAPMWSKRVSDAVLRGSGLSHSTQSNKWAFGMMAQGELADNVSKSFNKLEPNLQKQFKKYGIDEKEWDIIRKTKLYDAGIDDPSMAGKGMYFLRPDDIHARADLDNATREFLTTRLQTWLKNETNFAVPTASAKGRITLSGNAKPGTLKGEIVNSMLMYKNFAITLGMTHLARGFQQQGLMGKAKYLIPMILGGTVMGAFAYEIKQVAAGKKPTPISEMGVRYWLNAAIYGGGLGIFGDFLFSDQNRYGGSMSKTLTGPGVNFLDDAVRLTVGNTLELLSGEKTNAGKELAAFIQRYTPGSNLWYTRLVIERMIFDSLEKLLNPNFEADNRRNINKLRSRTGQEYWWSPGEIKPN